MAEPNRQDLMRVMRADGAEELRVWLAHGLAADAVYGTGSLLWWAVFAGAVECVRALLAAGASVADCRSPGLGLLADAAYTASPAIMSDLLESPTCPCAGQDVPPLVVHCAVLSRAARFAAGEAEAADALAAVVLLLEKYGGDPSACCLGVPALHFAARAGDADLARLLLAAGADVNAVAGDTGYTALRSAVRYGRDNVAAILVAAGAA